MNIHHDYRDVSDHCLLTYDINLKLSVDKPHNTINSNAVHMPKTDGIYKSTDTDDIHNYTDWGSINCKREQLRECLEEQNTINDINAICDSNDTLTQHEIDKVDNILTSDIRNALFKTCDTKPPPSSRPQPADDHMCDELKDKINETCEAYKPIARSRIKGRRNSADWENFTRIRDEKST